MAAEEVGDQEDWPSSMKRLTLLVDSLSTRILSWEEKAFGGRDSLTESGFSAPEMRRIIRQEITELDRRVSRLDLFDKVSELLRQADFRLEKQPEAALSLYEQAIGLDPTSIAARVGQAKADLDPGRHNIGGSVGGACILQPGMLQELVP
jgi:hypothetical protein